MVNKIRGFLPLAVAITGLSGLILLTVQQSYRMNANDPQIEMAENLANTFSNGTNPSTYKIGSFDVSKSLYPFVIVYDSKGNVITSGATINGKTPALPQGVLDSAKTSGERRVTWQPATGVRIAAVVTSYKSQNGEGFVLAGRNLHEVEVREGKLTQDVALGWIVTLLATFFATTIFAPTHHKN